MTQDKLKRKGFTLVELLIVMGILATILSIFILAINPFEHINQANDVATKAIVQDFSNATATYFTYKQTLPWQADTTCKNELAKGPTLKDVPTCVADITESTQLKSKVLTQNQVKDIYVSECNHAIALCYHPKSQLFGSSPDAKYTKNGALDPNCQGTNKTDECYACTFSTNDAQECFEALNPNGNLARTVSPDPSKPIPIPQRNSKPLCNTPASGQVACSAKVVSSSSGTPFTSVQLPAGLGPLQLHTAYNLPCTPGGPVQAICNTPSIFGPQTLAVVVAFHDPTLESDLTTYSQAYGLPSCTSANGCLTVVNEFGQTSPLPTATQGDWALEESLDVEMSHTVCQTCKILVVEANTNYLNDIEPSERVAASLGATSISNSYGTQESANSAWDQSYIHKGVYVTAASGDWGYGLYFPAASRYVIAVGATRLSLLPDNEYSSETAWSGTGGGCSAYQNAWNFQEAVPNWNLTGCGTKRSVADFSAVGDPSTGVAVYDSTPYGTQSGWWVVGGTSASSPIAAAALTLSATLPADMLGSVYIYAHPEDFRDVTTGSNGNCGTTACNATTGYDGPTGLGSPNILLSAITSIPPSPTPTPTPTRLSCTTQQTVTLSQPGPILALPGNTINNNLIVTNNDPVGCSTTFTISLGYPTGWTLNGIPTSFTLSGGATKYIPFTVQIPTSATAATYTYQFWVAKQGQSSVNPVNGSIQVQQVGPTNTPTPAPISCNNWTQSLASTSLSGNAGDTLPESITFTNNNPAGCNPITFPISYAYPSGFTMLNIPPSVTVSSGQSTTVPFSIIISTGASIQDYLAEFWTYSGGANMNVTIHVTGTSQPPQQQMFSNFGGHQYGDYATFEFSYNAIGSSDLRLDVATDPSALNQTTGPNSAAYYGFAYSNGIAWDASNNATPTSVRGFIVSTPTSWSGWKCGATIYYRMYNNGDLRITSPIQSTVVDCNTVVTVLPWSPWYSAIYQGVYDSRYDVDNNGIVNWNDYWILVRATRLR